MRKMKIILEFSKFNSGINILTIDGVPFSMFNKTIYRGNFSFGEEDFSIVLSCDGKNKEISLPFGLFLDYIEKKDPNLSSYIVNLKDFDEIFTDLKDFEWDFQGNIESYINYHYNVENFGSIEEYDGLADDWDEWDDEDQTNFDDLVDI